MSGCGGTGCKRRITAILTVVPAVCENVFVRCIFQNIFDCTVSPTSSPDVVADVCALHSGVRKQSVPLTHWGSNLNLICWAADQTFVLVTYLDMDRAATLPFSLMTLSTRSEISALNASIDLCMRDYSPAVGKVVRYSSVYRSACIAGSTARMYSV